MSEFIANDRPIVASYKGELLFPFAVNYPESKFGGFLATTNFRDPFNSSEIEANGWMLWPPIRFSFGTVDNDLPTAAPTPPTWAVPADQRCAGYALGDADPGCILGNWHWLGTDDQGRDVVARLLYGFRISVLFGLILSGLSSVIGIAAGAVQGYFGGWIDLTFQRFIEIWTSIPSLYLLLIISSVIAPSFWSLLAILLLFGWVSLVGPGARRVPARPQFRVCRGGAGAGGLKRHHHAAASVAECHGGDAHLPALHPGRLDRHPHLARFPRLRPAGRLALARRAAAARARRTSRRRGSPTHRLHRHRADAVAAGLHRRGGARRVRSAQGVPMSDPAERREPHIDFHMDETVLQAVRGISFDVEAGRTLALVGESGSGKSVTAHSILRLLPYPPATVPRPHPFKGEDLLPAAMPSCARVRGNAISMIFQEPMSSLNPLHTIGRQVSEVVMVHRGLRKRAAPAPSAIELLELVGIPDAARRLDDYPHQLSGGQRQRVMIAMALANEPDLLIADEPTTALDVTVQAQILELLRELQAKRGMAMLFITHDLGIVRHMADTVCVMTEGRDRRARADRRCLRQSAAPLYAPSARRRTEGRRRRPPIPGAVSSRRRTICGSGSRSSAACCAAPSATSRRSTMSASSSARGETLGRRRRKRFGQDDARPRAAAARLPSEGRIVFLGDELQGRSWRQMQPLRKDMQIVFQDPYGSLSPRMSVAEIVGEGLQVHAPSLSAADRDRKVAKALSEVGLDPDRHRYPHEFSGGQRQRIAIARAMVLEPKFVVLDEPTSALDMSVQAQVVDLLRTLQARRRLTYLFISHDLRVVRALANELIVMQDGKVVEAGPAAAIFDNPQSAYTRRLMEAAFTDTAIPPPANDVVGSLKRPSQPDHFTA